jgi:hypothetical protein
MKTMVGLLIVIHVRHAFALYVEKHYYYINKKIMNSLILIISVLIRQNEFAATYCNKDEY